jgi:hypothetical protein
MKHRTLISSLLILVSTFSFAQGDPFEKISFILGEWAGSGSGFGNEESRIESSFTLVMNGNFIQVTNDSRFEPTAGNPEGEHHTDEGFISYDKDRDLILFRQYHIEGYVTSYLLVDSLSNDSQLIFLTESIENFVPGGSARWTINKISDNHIETVFDVSFPNRGYTCFGINQLFKKE